MYGNNGCPSIAQSAKRTRFKRGTSPTPHFTRLIVLPVVDCFVFFPCVLFFPPCITNLPCQDPQLFFNFCSAVLSLYIVYFVELTDLNHPLPCCTPSFFGKPLVFITTPALFGQGVLKRSVTFYLRTRSFPVVRFGKEVRIFYRYARTRSFFLARIRTVGLIKCCNLRYTAP